MMRRMVFSGVLACASVTAGAALAGDPGSFYPYQQQPLRLKQIGGDQPQGTYRWDPVRGTWYSTGSNWRYFNPAKRVEDRYMAVQSWPPVPYGVYVEPR